MYNLPLSRDPSFDHRSINAQLLTEMCWAPVPLAENPSYCCPYQPWNIASWTLWQWFLIKLTPCWSWTFLAMFQTSFRSIVYIYALVYHKICTTYQYEYILCRLPLCHAGNVEYVSTTTCLTAWNQALRASAPASISGWAYCKAGWIAS